MRLSLASLCGVLLYASTALAGPHEHNNVPAREEDGKLFPQVDVASVVGSHRDIHSQIIAKSDRVLLIRARFSNGDRIMGTHFCSRVDAIDSHGYLVAVFAQRAGVDATFGGATKVKYVEDDSGLPQSSIDKIKAYNISQDVCSTPTFMSNAEDAAHVYAKSQGKDAPDPKSDTGERKHPGREPLR